MKKIFSLFFCLIFGLSQATTFSAGKFFISHAAAGIPPTLDGHNNVHNWSNSSSGSVSLTTTKTNDLIVVVIGLEKTTNTPPTVTSVTATGLTFTQRVTIVNTGGNLTRMDVWSAPSSGTLTAASITVNTSATIDDGVIIAFGINGLGSTSSPWDSNVSLPASAFSNNTTPPSVTFSTSHGNDFIFTAAGCQCNATGNFNPPSGFSTIEYGSNNGASTVQSAGAYYKVVSTTVSETDTIAGSGLTGSVIIGDATSGN